MKIQKNKKIQKGKGNTCSGNMCVSGYSVDYIEEQLDDEANDFFRNQIKNRGKENWVDLLISMNSAERIEYLQSFWEYLKADPISSFNKGALTQYVDDLLDREKFPNEYPEYANLYPKFINKKTLKSRTVRLNSNKHNRTLRSDTRRSYFTENHQSMNNKSKTKTKTKSKKK